MTEKLLPKTFSSLKAHEETIRSLLHLLDEQAKKEEKLRANLTAEVETGGSKEAHAQLQQLNWLDRVIDSRKKSQKLTHRCLEEMETICSELKQFEFRERITMVEVKAETLRQRREAINQELIPDAEERMQRYQDELKKIDSGLLKLNEQISKLRRRTEDADESR